MKCFLRITAFALLSVSICLPALGAERKSPRDQTPSTQRRQRQASPRQSRSRRQPSTSTARRQTPQRMKTQKPINTTNSRFRGTSKSPTKPLPAKQRLVRNNLRQRVDPKTLMARPGNPKVYGPPAKYVPGRKQSNSRQRPNFNPQKPSSNRSTPQLSQYRGKPRRMTIGRPATPTKKFPPQLASNKLPENVRIPDKDWTPARRRALSQRMKTANVIDQSRDFAQEVAEHVKRPGLSSPRPRRGSEVVAEMIDRAGRSAEQAIDDPVGTAERAARHGRDTVNSHVGATRDFVRDQVRTGRDVVGNTYENARDTMQGQVNAGKEQVRRGRDYAQSVAKDARDIAQDHVNSGQAAYEWAAGEVQGGLNEAEREARPIVEATNGAAQRVGNAIGRKVEQGKRAGQNAVEKVQDTAQSTADAAQQAAEEARQAAEQAAQQAAEAAQQAAEQAAQQAAEAAQQAAEQAAQQAEQAKEAAKQAAKDAVQGSADAVTSFIDGLF